MTAQDVDVHKDFLFTYRILFLCLHVLNVCYVTLNVLCVCVPARSVVDGLRRLRGAVSLAHEQPQMSNQKNLPAGLFGGHVYDTCQRPGEL